MPSSRTAKMAWWRSYPARLLAAALGWLLLISLLHYWLNTDHDQRQVVKMGYMPVITNLAAPLLDHASLQASGSIRFKAIKFASFAEMAEALRNDEIQAAFIIAPLSIVLRQQGEDVKVVYIGNRHESTFVVRRDIKAKRLSDLIGRTIAVPMRYSGHNLGLLKDLRQEGLDGQVRIVEMNPPDMASALSAGSLDGYFVGEPFAAQTLKNGDSNLFYYVEQHWPDFICNLLLVHQRLIDRDSSAVGRLVEGAARSGLWADRHPDEAAAIASRYWGQPVDLVKYALKTPPDRIVYTRFIPRTQELAQIEKLMIEFGLLESGIGVEELAEPRFALGANLEGVDDVGSILIRD